MWGLMHWRRRRAEAVEAGRIANQALEETQRDVEQTDRLAHDLHRLHSRNHLTPRIREAFLAQEHSRGERP